MVAKSGVIYLVWKQSWTIVYLVWLAIYLVWMMPLWLAVYLVWTIPFRFYIHSKEAQ